MANYVYRSSPEMEKGKDIPCKDPNSPANIVTFIRNGSVMATKFISTTKLLGVCTQKYSVGLKKAGKVIPGKRPPVVLVDLDNIKDEIHDCSTDEALKAITKEELNEAGIEDKSSKAWKMAIDRTKADREIILEYKIPLEAYREIPPMLVDVLDAFEQANTLDSKFCMKVINDMIMEDKANELIDIIDNIKFNEVEQIIISEYYEKMNNMNQVSQDFGQYVDDKVLKNLETSKNNSMLKYVTAIKAQITKNILSNEEFRQKIETRKKEIQKEEKGEITDTNYDKLLEKYYVIPEGAADTTSKKQKDVNNAFIGRPNVAIKVKDDEIKPMLNGAEYIKEDGKITSLNVLFSNLRKPIDKTSLHLYPYIEKDGYGHLFQHSTEVKMNSKIYENDVEKDSEYEYEEFSNGKNALEDCMQDNSLRKGLYEEATRTVKQAIRNDKTQDKDIINRGE